MRLKNIRKIVLFFLLTAFLSSLCFPIKKGIKGGICFGMFRFTETGIMGETKIHTGDGNSIGFYITTPLLKKLLFQPEIYYSVKKAQGQYEYQFRVPPATEIHYWTFQYIEIPLLLKFHPGLDRAFNVMFFVGPSAAFRLSCSGFADVMRTDIMFKLTDKVKWFDYGLVFGGGVDFAMSDEVSMIIDLRYYLGLSNIARENNETFTNIKSNGIYVLFGVQF